MAPRCMRWAALRLEASIACLCWRADWLPFVRPTIRRTFDVLHGLWADEPGFLAVSAGRLLGVPAVVSLLGGELVALPEIGYGGQLSRSNRWLTGQALRHAHAVTTGSELLREIAAPCVGRGRLAVQPLGVDTHLFCPAQPDRVPESVMSSGRRVQAASCGLARADQGPGHPVAFRGACRKAASWGTLARAR